jgi:hypothetical protein
MYDRRIHRGNTYASPTLPTVRIHQRCPKVTQCLILITHQHTQADPVELQKQQDLKRRLKAKRKAEARRRVRTPDAVEGRKHIDVQTDLYLEELSDKVPEAIAATQTDAFLNRAPSPLFIPQKSGIDVATQVYDGELFDFDFEVTPILEILVGKTVEQSLMEIHEEEELDLLKRHQVCHYLCFLKNVEPDNCDNSDNSKTNEMLNSLKSKDSKRPNVAEQKKKKDALLNNSDSSRKSKRRRKRSPPVLLLRAISQLWCPLSLTPFQRTDSFMTLLRRKSIPSFFPGLQVRLRKILTELVWLERLLMVCILLLPRHAIFITTMHTEIIRSNI